jgi:hypothetical protein
MMPKVADVLEDIMRQAKRPEDDAKKLQTFGRHHAAKQRDQNMMPKSSRLFGRHHAAKQRDQNMMPKSSRLFG